MNPLISAAGDIAADLLLHLMAGDLSSAQAKIVERAAIRAARAAADVAAEKKFGQDIPPEPPA